MEGSTGIKHFSRKIRSLGSSRSLKRAEGELEKKQEELIRAKKRHQKLAGEFIDLWIKVKRLKKQNQHSIK